ncbi:MAG: exosome complex RNA-binding protein Rrp4 [Candidatus Hecatellaceae archaeon]|nr:MAG: RNA-binding protein [Candidatus Hecatellales archaeon]
MPLLVERRQLVAPGDLLAEGEYLAGDNAYKDDGRIYAQRLGLADVRGKRVSVVALKGPYMPRVGDLVIGRIVDTTLGGWIVDINSPYTANLSVSDVMGKSFSPEMVSLTKILAIGDIIIAKISAFDRTRDPALTIKERGLGKVEGGVVIDLTPTKVPRLIGKKGSMINMIKQLTGCEVIAGQNGKVLIKGRNLKMVELAIHSVRMVEEQAHTSGLTDRIRKFIEEKK